MNHAIAQTATFNFTLILQTATDSSAAASAKKGQPRKYIPSHYGLHCLLF
jgi:hypothetical protein